MDRRRSIRLIKEFINEVVVAGEAPITDLYLDYRPADPKAYIGMTSADTTTEPATDMSTDSDVEMPNEEVP
jgi:hypothetical protein